MRILLTGAAGQLGRAFSRLASAGHEVTPTVHHRGNTGMEELDLADLDAIPAKVARFRPNWVVHAGAMTNVDACEKNPIEARRINALATGRIAEGAKRAGASMAYVSTDYVFDGTRGNYVETDTEHPLSVYGATKLEGEHLAAAALPRLLITRTSVVLSAEKRNFVTWLVEELRTRRRVRIVEDQRVTPTLADDLAAQILALVQADATGVFHTAGGTSLSRIEMAHLVARVFDVDAGLIDPVPASELAWTAPRPRDSTLDTSKVSKYQRPLPFEAALGILRERMSVPKSNALPGEGG
ncbi:MAG: dTDP-4-dehydrorhamnose reductase [Thermoplasmatota archaeon]